MLHMRRRNKTRAFSDNVVRGKHRNSKGMELAQKSTIEIMNLYNFHREINNIKKHKIKSKKKVKHQL